MQPYEPQELPIKNIDARRLISLVGEASSKLSLYNGLLSRIVNPDLLLGPLETEEAVLSSKIEGTQATIDDIYEHEAGISRSSGCQDDIQEVLNYRRALKYAQEYLKDGRISLYFLKAIHAELLQGVRGQNKSPGEFRDVQNWIGKPDSDLGTATFVPPSPFRLVDHLEAWERYVLSDDIDILIQAAVMHAQFELLHPFKDGNGRMGRLLIPLFLHHKKRLDRPMFYLSGYLEMHRETYYAELSKISKTGDWNDWIAFFLKAILTQSETNLERVQRINELYDEMKVRIENSTHSQYAIRLLDKLFERPVFQAADFAREMGLSKATGIHLVKELRSNGILTEVQPASGRRSAVMCFPSLLSLVDSKINRMDSLT